jgi:hypothetical protein
LLSFTGLYTPDTFAAYSDFEEDVGVFLVKDGPYIGD